MKKVVSIFALSLFPVFTLAEQTSWFQINQVLVSSAENAHFRVYGMPNMSTCSIAPSWAYVNEDDSGAKGKISTLLAAYTAKKNVQLNVTAGSLNGNTFCKIKDISVKD